MAIGSPNRCLGNRRPADTQAWIRELSADDVDDIREQALAGLVKRGVLERKEERFLWVLRSVRHPTIDSSFEREIKDRIEEVLADEIPDPRDVALLSLVDACDILPDIFPDREFGKADPGSPSFARWI